MVLCHRLDVKQKKELVIYTEAETVRTMWWRILSRGNAIADIIGAITLTTIMEVDQLSKPGSLHGLFSFCLS